MPVPAGATIAAGPSVPALRSAWSSTRWSAPRRSSRRATAAATAARWGGSPTGLSTQRCLERRLSVLDESFRSASDGCGRTRCRPLPSSTLPHARGNGLSLPGSGFGARRGGKSACGPGVELSAMRFSCRPHRRRVPALSSMAVRIAHHCRRGDAPWNAYTRSAV